jgi:hypothetical protein
MKVADEESGVLPVRYHAAADFHARPFWLPKRRGQSVRIPDDGPRKNLEFFALLKRA